MSNDQKGTLQATVRSRRLALAYHIDVALKQGITRYKPNMGLCTRLEVCLCNGIRVDKYEYSDPDTHARTMARQ